MSASNDGPLPAPLEDTVPLARLSLLYVTLPVIIFIVGWIRWPVALVALAALVAASWKIWARGGISLPRWRGLRRSIPPRFLLAAGPLSALSGAGGLVAQTSDWLKHDAILATLITCRWPVECVDPTGTHKAVLTYGLAYYLPSAVLGKVAGFTAAQVMVWLWTAVGIALVLSWVWHLSGRWRWAPAVFLLFSGADVIGKLLVLLARLLAKGSFRAMADPALLEFWSGNWQYSSTTTLLLWVPQHALATWLVASFLLAATAGRGTWRPGIVLTAAMVPFWSPLAAVGVAPLLVLSMWINRRTVRDNLGTTELVAALSMALIAASFFSSRLFASFPATDSESDFSLIFAHPRVESLGLGATVVLLVAFLLLEIGTFAIPLLLSRPRLPRRWNRVVVGASAILLALPVFRYGYFNDLAMRASIGPLFCLALATIMVLGDRMGGGNAKRWLVVAFFVGLATPISQLTPRLLSTLRHPGVIPIEAAPPLQDLRVDKEGPLAIWQYLGRPKIPWALVLRPSNAIDGSCGRCELPLVAPRTNLIESPMRSTAAPSRTSSDRAGKP